jgi:hypothetical protein
MLVGYRSSHGRPKLRCKGSAKVCISLPKYNSIKSWADSDFCYRHQVSPCQGSWREDSICWTQQCTCFLPHTSSHACQRRRVSSSIKLLSLIGTLQIASSNSCQDEKEK